MPFFAICGSIDSLVYGRALIADQQGNALLSLRKHSGRQK
jgi:hypothetical protein